MKGTINQDIVVKRRINLMVPFVEKEKVKALGAKWDPVIKKWYIFEDNDVSLFLRWMPKKLEKNLDLANCKGHKRISISLSEYLADVQSVFSKKFDEYCWLKGEINGYSEKNGHVFFSFVERDTSGNQIASIKSQIWRNSAMNLLKKFKEGTGKKLDDNIKTMFYAKAIFHANYGVSLQIQDVDPTYTLGRMIQKLHNIRKILKKENIYYKNKSIPKPVDFTCVAVISPQNAAGLGDFKHEASKLEAFDLCCFEYYSATFQGTKAAKSIVSAIKKVLYSHKKNKYDALVFIRGGGAIIDLAWLNDIDLARNICNLSFPVMSGIGHEKDSTIIDEIAAIKFDTPSKVSNFIFEKICTNANNALLNKKKIETRTKYLLTFKSAELVNTKKMLMNFLNNLLTKKDKNINNFRMLLYIFLKQKTKYLGKRLFYFHEEIFKKSSKVLVFFDGLSNELIRSIFHKMFEKIRQRTVDIDKSIKRLQSLNEIRLNHKSKETSTIKETLLQSSVFIVKGKKRKLKDFGSDLKKHLSNFLNLSDKKIQKLMEEIVNLGPRATLKRGFTVVRNKSSVIVKRKRELINCDTISVEFMDGKIYTKILDFEG